MNQIESMKILIACEFSGIVRDAFIARGHDAISCDLLPSESPGPHYQGDLREYLYRHDLGGDIKWDMIIAFPPCTHLAKSGARYWKEKQADGRQQDAIRFFMWLVNQPCPRICIENPIGIMSRDYRKSPWPGWAMQTIQPHWFGDKYMKTTCLWLKGLPPLMATKPMLEKGEPYIARTGKRAGKVNGSLWYQMEAPGKDRSKNRSRTFPGVAKAMAQQWG